MDDRFDPRKQSSLDVLRGQQKNECSSEPLFEFVVECAEAEDSLDKSAEQRDR